MKISMIFMNNSGLLFIVIQQLFYVNIILVNINQITTSLTSFYWATWNVFNYKIVTIVTDTLVHEQII